MRSNKDSTCEIYVETQCGIKSQNAFLYLIQYVTLMQSHKESPNSLNSNMEIRFTITNSMEALTPSRLRPTMVYQLQLKIRFTSYNWLSLQRSSPTTSCNLPRNTAIQPWICDH